MTFSKFRVFLRQPVHYKLQIVLSMMCRIKSQLLYPIFFRKFGRNSFIQKPMMISHPEYISIEEGVSIRSGVRLEAVIPHTSRTPSISIGRNTNIEQNVHIVCHSRITIGERVSITGGCAIVDVTHPFEKLQAGEKIGIKVLDEDSFVEIGDGAFIGYGATILPNVRIGRGAVIGARSVVTTNIPDYAVAVGSPARVVRTYHPGIQNAG